MPCFLTVLLFSLLALWLNAKIKFLGLEKMHMIQGLEKMTHEELACIFPGVDPFLSEIVQLSGRGKPPLRCDPKRPDLTSLQGKRLSMDTQAIKRTFGKLSAVECGYREIYRYPTSDWDIITGNWTKLTEETIQLSEQCEFVHVVCNVNKTEMVSNAYYALIPKRSAYDDLYTSLLEKRAQWTQPLETLSVVMVGFDGVSRHQFLRSMNKTYRFLMDDLRSFDMGMYTQVGKDTFENYLALLGGHSWSDVSKFWSFRKPGDSLDLIFREFEDAGYRTLFTEDGPSGGAFHYQKLGFLSTPTAYNSRPITLALSRDVDMFRAGPNCVGSKPEFLYHMDYVRTFLDTFARSPVFVFSFLTRLTHDDMTHLASADDLMFDVYTALKKAGHFNRTLVITFSDHGPRTGMIRTTFNGMVESRNPYAIFTFPLWFLRKYPEISNNLKINTARLTTHFDTHATMRDLMYFGSVEHPLKTGQHGKSLFREIPINRTCKDIPIPPEFCLCGQRGDMTNLDLSSALALTLAHSLMAELRTNINFSLCANLTLKNILQITNMNLVEPKSQQGSNRFICKVRVQTSPGDAIFEGTVFIESGKDTSLRPSMAVNKVLVGKVIERLNLYRGQAECVEDANQRLFCFCKERK